VHRTLPKAIRLIKPGEERAPGPRILADVRLRLMSRLTAVALTLAAACGLSACGGSSSTPQGTLQAFLAAWQKRDWPAMRRQVATPPADFAAVNEAALSGLGVTTARFSAGRVIRTGAKASAAVTETFGLPVVGTWPSSTKVSLVQRKGTWLVSWSPATINPALRAGDRLLVARDWPARAPILGVGGVPLVTDHGLITVGLVGSRITDPKAVRRDLLAAGAPVAQTDQALAQAKAHPSLFEPVFQVSMARFAQLKRQSGPENAYSVPGTTFERSSSRTAITPNLAAHVVGSVGAITADELKQLGAPYDTASQVGRTGLENIDERQLAGTPTTHVEVVDAHGATVRTLQSYNGHPGRPVPTSIDPRVQRAAESALANVGKHAGLVAMRASTGQVLAAVSVPAGYPYDQALHGAFPPGSTFKVLTSTALIQHGLSPSSPASCPPSLTINGEVFHNAEGDQTTQTLDQAFTESCNTAFIGLATQRLRASDFTAAAKLYGLQRITGIGVPASQASVPAPSGQTALAATAIGQAQVTFSPLGMASVASAIDTGTVRAPRLVQGAPDDRVATAALPPAVATGLRLMMGHVAQSGTAAGTGLPAGTHAKTGTAQYEQGSALNTDAWLMGYDGAIAFAIVVQDSGGVNGGPLDGPLIAKFFQALGSSG
jgi:cell division protein FtsI/penicillin-binding protein 2